MKLISDLRDSPVRWARIREGLGQITSAQAHYCLPISDVHQNICPSHICFKTTNIKIRQYLLNTLVN